MTLLGASWPAVLVLVLLLVPVATVADDARAIDDALGSLESPQPHIRTDAAEELGRLKAASAVERLIECLGDPEDDVRFAAAQALGEIGDPAAIEPIARAVYDDRFVRQDDALRVLGKLGPEAIDPLATFCGPADFRSMRRPRVRWA